MKQLETPRLLLRAWRYDDLEDFYAYAQHPEVGPAAGWRPHESKEETMAILMSFIDKAECYAIIDKETNKVIGSLGMHPDSKRKFENCKMIGYVLAQPYWGNGLMSEAVGRIITYLMEEVKLDLISVYHFPFNHKSQRVIEKCGFVYEGTLRMDFAHYNGTNYDSMCYSMTQEDYRAFKNNQNQ